ncbi:acetate--CoA ligase family protein, partial [Halorubrum sp. Boch-26]|uniref:acetate--CoA ligase family protein n=1 Tax=Halorubrum sp. Boch-26 TaxID=2994426 RepID=UPI002468C05E
EAKAAPPAGGAATPELALAADPAAAVDAADRIGYPVAAKVSSPAVAHKSEWGDGAGVAVGLTGPDAVREAAERIDDAAAAAGIEASVLVESMADLDAGTEVIVGGTNDPSFGPTTLVGLGGTFTEVYGDVTHRIAPVTHREARDAVTSLTAAPLLTGHRGRPPADLDALVDVVRTVGDLLDASPEIAEIDLNPVLATPDGATALDGLVVLADPDGASGDTAAADTAAADADADAGADDRGGERR